MAVRLHRRALAQAPSPRPTFTATEQRELLEHFEDLYSAAYGETYRRAPRRDAVDLEYLATRGTARDARKKISLAFARPWEHDERVTLDVVFSGWDELEEPPRVGSREWRDLAVLARGGDS